MSFPFGAALALAAVAGICFASAGCGSGDPLANMSAKQVLNKAISDLQSVPGYTISGTVSTPPGSLISSETLHLAYRHGTGCKGTIGFGALGSVYLVVIGGTAWVKPDAAYWKTSQGKSAQQVITAVGGRYLKGSASNRSFATLIRICAAKGSPISMRANVVKDAIVKGAVTTVDGQQVVPLKDKTMGGTVYVTDAAAPQILQVIGIQAGSRGKVTFTYGQVNLTPPPASDTIDGSSFTF
jgi:hypothetical protein